MPAIIDGWNSQELINRASSDFRKKYSDDGIKSSLDTSAKNLGNLIKFNIVNGESAMELGGNTTADYKIQADFEKASNAEIDMGLIRENSSWKIRSIHITHTAQ